jgi:choline-sulfatase
MNFLLFLPDAVRAESLGTYGHPITKTPAFDRLAKEGTLFEQAHTLSTVLIFNISFVLSNSPTFSVFFWGLLTRLKT